MSKTKALLVSSAILPAAAYLFHRVSFKDEKFKRRENPTVTGVADHLVNRFMVGIPSIVEGVVSRHPVAGLFGVPAIRGAQSADDARDRYFKTIVESGTAGAIAGGVLGHHGLAPVKGAVPGVLVGAGLGAFGGSIGYDLGYSGRKLFNRRKRNNS